MTMTAPLRRADDFQADDPRAPGRLARLKAMIREERQDNPGATDATIANAVARRLHRAREPIPPGLERLVRAN